MKFTTVRIEIKNFEIGKIFEVFCRDGDILDIDIWHKNADLIVLDSDIFRFVTRSFVLLKEGDSFQVEHIPYHNPKVIKRGQYLIKNERYYLLEVIQ